MTERETQKKIILEHLSAGEKLTPADAYRLTGSTRLSARIYDLRRDGHVINTEMITIRNRFGRTATVAQYSMEANSIEQVQ